MNPATDQYANALERTSNQLAATGSDTTILFAAAFGLILIGYLLWQMTRARNES